MIDAELQRKFLGKLYQEQFERDGGTRALDLLTTEDGKDSLLGLISGGVLQPSGKQLRLSTAGIVLVENENLGPHELIVHNHKVREAILQVLGQVHAESGGSGSMARAELEKRAAIDERDLNDNVELLMELKWIQAHGLGRFRIASAGMLVAKGLKLAAEQGGRLGQMRPDR